MQLHFEPKTFKPAASGQQVKVTWFISANNILFFLYYFWVIPRSLNAICRRFGKLCSISIGGVGVFFHTPNMNMEKCSETSEYKIQTPGNHPKLRTQHSEHGQSLQ
jgi:hypothetical protein